MLPITQEWLEKAEGDYTSARRELRARKRPNYDAACFHAQQCAEKYLKACLQEAGVRIPRTHDLAAMITLLPKPDLEWTALQTSLLRLSAYAVEFRYPGQSADKPSAQRALADAALVRAKARTTLGLKTI
jgi:HEPN domain-containing protein